MKVRVENMASSRGNRVPNQYIIYTDKGTFFQSYRTVIVWINNKGQTFLDAKSWDCSMTTGTYRNSFLMENKKETQKKIDTGEYKLKDLNKGS